MAFGIPNNADAGNSAQAQVDAKDIDILVAGMQGDGILTGCAVTAPGGMAVAVAVGVNIVGGVASPVASGNVTITAADGSNPRFDLIAVDNTGAKSAVAGTAAASPVFPAIPANSIIIAAVFVGAGVTSITSGNIIDKRVIVPFRGTIDKTTTQLDIVSSAAENTFYSVSLPANLLGTNRVVHFVLAGNYLNNSGAAKTLTLRVKYGATTMYDDVSGNIGANANRRAWRLDLYFMALGATNSQEVSGVMFFGEVAATTTGIGDFAQNFDTVMAGPIDGTAAIDSTATANFVVTVQHSASAATLSIRRNLAFTELIG